MIKVYVHEAKILLFQRQDFLVNTSLKIKGRNHIFCLYAILRTAPLPLAPKGKQCNASSGDDLGIPDHVQKLDILF